MKYILIENEGEIESNSFELIGASTKREDDTKIGFFGSGLKYSIAYMMRHNISFRVFSGRTELIFTTIPETLKEQSFDRICINDKPTSYTTTMGPTWDEDWFVLREIYCNALDEGTCRMQKDVSAVAPTSGMTRIYIESTPSLEQISRQWDAYFSVDRQPLWTATSIYTGYLSPPDWQPVEVFQRTAGTMYRKGIRVQTNETALYDYGFQDVYINEDRTARSAYALADVCANLMATMVDKKYVLNILRNPTSYEYRAIRSASVKGSVSPEWLDLSHQFLLVLDEQAGRYTVETAKSRKEVLHIPQSFARQLFKDLPDIEILGLYKMVGDVGVEPTTATPKMSQLLSDVLKTLKHIGYESPYEMQIVEFDDKSVLGKADCELQIIYLSHRIFDLGKKEIALTIMEETEHINSGYSDETRAFQNHLFHSWLTTMENFHQKYF